MKYTTKVTRLGNGQYGCRIFRGDVLVVEGRCDTRDQIGPTFRDMMRTIDKMGGDSFTHASRMRQFLEKNSHLYRTVKHYWGGKE